ncbi:transposase [Deinococcus malanensis]
MGERKRYSKEFKQEAVRLAKEPDQSVLQVARNLGISDSALHRWIREFEGRAPRLSRGMASKL